MNIKTLLITLIIVMCFLITNSLGVINADNAPSVNYSWVSNKDKANHFGLNEDQWKAYLEYMEVEGQYEYPELNPVFVLGIISTDQEEKEQLAYLYAEQNVKRTQKLLDHTRMISAASKALYPDEKLIDMSKIPSLSYLSDRLSIINGDAITFFTKADCSVCNKTLNDLKDRITREQLSTTINVFVVGAKNNDDLLKFAIENKITKEELKNRILTINIDDRWKDEIYEFPDLPSAFVIRNNEVLGKL